MGTRGYVAYRYKRKYYRQFIRWDAYPCGYGHGQRLANTVPRDSATFKDWVTDRIRMLENAKTTEIIDEPEHPDVVHPQDGTGADDLGFGTIYDNCWTFPVGLIEWTYVFDLDNLAFTINGVTHFKLDNMPPTLNYYQEDSVRIPTKYLRDSVDLWPIPDFDIEEQQRKYEALQPIIIPATEWGALTWDELSVSQRFSIEITHQWLHKTADIFEYAYVPAVRREVEKFGWDILCASIPALPIFQENDFQTLGLSPRTLSSGFNTNRIHPPYLGKPLEKPKSQEEDWIARQERVAAAFRNPHKYMGPNPIKHFWVRGCFVTFCVRLGEPIYVAHEVEQMVQKMRVDGPVESVGIILSSQQELVVVAVDGPQVRHSPVLDIHATDGRPGRATDCRLLLTHLLSVPCTISPLPWRPNQPRHSPVSHSNSISDLPPEVLQLIVDLTDMKTYLALSCVSRSIHAACITNPRIGRYIVLHKMDRFKTIFAARSTDDHALKTIDIWWQFVKSDYYLSRGKWEIREVSPEELDEMKTKEV